MAETKSKSKTTVVCTLCDKPITTGKPVMIDDDPYHSDCAKAMEQSAGAAAPDDDEEEEAEEADETEEDEEDGEDEGDEAEEDEEEDEVPAPRATKVTAKAPAKSAKRVVAVEEDDEDEDDEDPDDDDEEEEEVVVTRPAAKKAAAKAAPARRIIAEEEDDDDDDDDEEEEEVVVTRPAAKKAVAVKATAKATPKRVAADEEYEEEDEPEARPTKAKTATAKKPKAPAVDMSGWGNPATYGSKRYFVYQALNEVSKNDLTDPEGPGKPDNVITRAKVLQRAWAKETKTTLSEKDRNFTSMNVGWINNHADELGLVMRSNPEAGTYRIWKTKAKDAE